MAKKKILVTGGAGYIGSHTLIDLIEQGFDVISIDNFCRSEAESFQRIQAITGVEVKNYAINLCDYAALKEVLAAHQNIEGIIHFAALKAVYESVEQPILYYENNLYSLLNILKGMQEFEIKNLVFSSSCSVYGNTEKLPVNEETPLANPESPYAATKQMGEQMIMDFTKSFASHCILLRYFNPVGAHSSGKIGEVPFDKPNNLVPVITQTAAGLLPKMYVWGNDYDTRDGTCIRDYIHVMDIAHAHTNAIRYALSQQEQNLEIFNLGSGRGVTVKEAIEAFEEVSGLTLNYEIGPRRTGDVIAIYADNTLAKTKLQWSPDRTIQEMIRSAWLWQQQLSSIQIDQ